MRRITQPSADRRCQRCGDEIPTSKRADAAYCSTRCRGNTEKLRYKARHPEYAERQRRLVNEIRHKQEFGHTEFLDNPLLNKRDKYRVARSLGFRSLLEHSVAKQLEEAGVEFQYEPFPLRYSKPMEVSHAH